MNQDKEKWQSHLGNSLYAGLFDDAFFARWGDRNWAPNEADALAAAELHTQINSRITIQDLRYCDGVPAAALTSVYALFDLSRTIVTKHPGCVHFEETVWHVLNQHVRPFTAKWHGRSESGALDALDATDGFRADLIELRPFLMKLDLLLLELRDGTAPPGAGLRPPSDIGAAMSRALRWGIRDTGRFGPGASIKGINKTEKRRILERRHRLGIPVRRPYATGLALSGGGIRSAAFSLGVLGALAGRNVLPHVDYLSTVSGGGYLGSFLTAFLGSPPSGTAPKTGLAAGDDPLGRENGDSDAVRHIRQNCRYLLNGSIWGRIGIAFAQLYGITVNLAAFTGLLGVVSAVLLAVEALPPQWGDWALDGLLLTLVAVAVLLPAVIRLFAPVRPWADAIIAVPAGLVGLLVFGKMLTAFHNGPASLPMPAWALLLLAGGLTVAAPTALVVSGRRSRTLQRAVAALATLSMPLFLLGCEWYIYHWLQCEFEKGAVGVWKVIAIASGMVIAFAFMNLNMTSLHRHYRNKLAATFLIRRRRMDPALAHGSILDRLASVFGIRRPAGSGTDYERGVSVKLSEIGESFPGPYPLLNAALNAPNSSKPAMQGRLTDFFLFSPAYCGSPVLGYLETSAWELQNPELDLGAAMAASGAAVSPQMGMHTSGYLRFWLALLNVRLSYWLQHPNRRSWLRAGPTTPKLRCLLSEMFGFMNEDGTHLCLTDGGHIENLGVYELLRRRCKYIIAVDGEQDGNMTFHALATLQRMAMIDLNTDIQIDVDDLRLDGKGFSRSHFTFCRILYPNTESCGYLLYIKLSLTGNEGEFIRRYKLDEPDFPHHSTADQFFTEAQFEAYRYLGEHIGEKLFAPAIVGKAQLSPGDELGDWLRRIGASMLMPQRH